MSEPTISYSPYGSPRHMGNDLWLYGVYRVRYPDGFTVITPHRGWWATATEPFDLDDPDVREMLTSHADRVHASHG